MTWFEILTAGAAWLALLLSLWGLYWSRKLTKEQLARWSAEAEACTTSKLSVRIEEGSSGKASALVIENIGLVDALDVRLDLTLLPSEDNFIFVGHSPKELFPVPKLSPGEVVTLRYSAGMDGPEFLKVSLTWLDTKGRAQSLERRLEI